MPQTVKCLPARRETWVRSLGREDPLEKEMATHSSTLVWKIQSMGVSKSRTLLSDFIFLFLSFQGTGGAAPGCWGKVASVAQKNLYYALSPGHLTPNIFSQLNLQEIHMCLMEPGVLFCFVFERKL